MNHLKPTYQSPLDKDFDPLISRCNGRNAYGNLVEWELSVKDLKITLTNDLGANYQLGKLAKPARSCSMAFLDFVDLYFVIEYLSGETVIFSVDLHEGVANSCDVEFGKYKSVSITFNKAFCRKGLVVAAIGADGVYRGTLIDSELSLELVEPLENSSKFRIHRFGLNTTNALSIELVEFAHTPI